MLKKQKHCDCVKGQDAYLDGKGNEELGGQTGELTDSVHQVRWPGILPIAKAGTPRTYLKGNWRVNQEPIWRVELVGIFKVYLEGLKRNQQQQLPLERD